MASILVVDDEEQFRKMLKQLLEEEGHSVFEASNGDEALAHYRRQPTDLIILDVFMPEKEGLETIQEIRCEYPDAKIIAISGGGKQGILMYLHYSKEFGADKTLAKPFDPPELFELIQELLNE